MAYDDQSFIQKLRQNQVLRPEGQGNPNPLIGMPNFMTGQRPQTGDGTMQLQSQPAPIEQRYDPSAGHIMAPNNMASAWVPGAADINAGRIVMGETPNENLSRALELQKNKDFTKDAVAIGNLGVKTRAQALKEKIAAGKATDAEKQEYALAQIGARGDETMEQINARGGIQKDIAGANIAGRANVAGINNAGAMDRIGKSITSRESIADADRLSREGIASGRNANQPPSQQNIQQQMNARRIANTDPEIGKFIVMQPNGSFSIGADADGNQPTDEQIKLLSSSIYGLSPSVDTDLTDEQKFRPGLPTSQQPARSNSTPTVTMPKVSMPKAGDPLGIR